MEQKHFSFFQNKDCEYFPCHKGVAEQQFNCLFCYCPLYLLGKECGGNPFFLENGKKDCSTCSLPHVADNYAYVKERLERVVERMSRN